MGPGPQVDWVEFGGGGGFGGQVPQQQTTGAVAFYTREPHQCFVDLSLTRVQLTLLIHHRIPTYGCTVHMPIHPLSAFSG